LNPQTQECTVIAIAVEGSPEEKFVCEIGPEDNNGESGHTLPIRATSAQTEKLRELLYAGDLESGFSTLRNEDFEISGDSVILSAVEEITLGQTSRRKLLEKTGDRYFLAVRVAALDKVVAATAASISNDIFGTDGTDPVNMVSQFDACSYGKFKIIPGPPPGTDIDSSIDSSLVSASGPEAGVMNVTISIALGNSTQDQVRNAITTVVQAELGFDLPGPFDAVMYIVEGCYVGDCGIAYALVNSWLSVYTADWYKSPSAQLHEIGHNLNLGHSGGLDGGEYSDQTGLVSGYYD
jgi:hypothetical protein